MCILCVLEQAHTSAKNMQYACSDAGSCFALDSPPQLSSDLFGKMVKLEAVYHPWSLHPLEAARAHHLRYEEGYTWQAIADETENLQGVAPSLKGVRTAVARVEAQRGALLPRTGYYRCGRKRILTEQEERAIVAFVKAWRHKRFCTCAYIKRELGLKVGKKTVARCLNRKGFFWRPVPKKSSLSAQDLKSRQTFVEKYEDKTPTWWENNYDLVLDGVTLTKAPKPLSARAKHAAQSIDHMWMKRGESMDKDVHTYNRYGVQLGVKVPLWGGFTGSGKFTLRLWTPRAKMTKVEWAARVPTLKRAVGAGATGPSSTRKRPMVWQDNEKFLKCSAEYRKHGLQLINFPTNSGDLNPIENVWAALRRDLATREQEDLDNGRTLTVAQFRARASQLLQSYSIPKPGQEYSFLRRLVRGMPRRLALCRANKFGRCGK